MIKGSLLHRIEYIVLMTMLVLAVSLTVMVSTVRLDASPYFSELAQSFMQGRLDLMSSPLDREDVAAVQGRAYWPLGPFPAIVVLPIVALVGVAFPLGAVALLFIGVAGWCIFRIAHSIGYTFQDRLWLIFAFLFASPFVAAAWVPRSWQFSHVIVVALMFAALYEYVTRKRLWLIGLLYAGIIMTRIPAGITLSFFFFDVCWQYRRQYQEAVRAAVRLLAAPAAAITLLLVYNAVRFGMPLEVGYSFANLGPELVRMRSFGIIDVVHIPGNLFYFLFAGPQPVTEPLSQIFIPPYIRIDRWGIGLLYSAPYFFALIWKRLTDRVNIQLWSAVVLTAAPVLMYFAIGPEQQAYRYSLDFLPMLFFLFMRTIYAIDRRLDAGFKWVISLAFILQFQLYITSLLRFA